MIKFSPPPSLAGGPPFTCERPGPPSNRRPAGPRSPHPDRGARQPTPNTTRPRIRAAAKVTSHFRVSPGSDRDAGAGGLLARGFQGRADPGGHAANLNPRLSTFEEPVLIGDGQLAIGGGGCGASRPEQLYLDPTRTAAGPLARDWARSRTSPEPGPISSLQAALRRRRGNRRPAVREHWHLRAGTAAAATGGRGPAGGLGGGRQRTAALRSTPRWRSRGGRLRPVRILSSRASRYRSSLVPQEGPVVWRGTGTRGKFCRLVPFRRSLRGLNVNRDCSREAPE